MTVARAAPDGYTILLATPDLTVNASLRPKLPYDAARDLTPIGLVGTYPMALVVNPSQGLDTVKTLLERARSEPGKMNYVGVPKPVIDRLNDALTQTLATPDIRGKLAGLGAVLEVGTPEAFGKLLNDEIGKWRQVIETAGIKVD